MIRPLVRRLLLAGVVSAALGVLTAYAQGWLPGQIGSLANSSGSWALVAFLLGLVAWSAREAAIIGALSLMALLVGYIVAAGIRGDPSSSGLIIFWGAAALVAGPLLGLGAHWVRSRRDRLAATGIGAMSGVLVGEGSYGLGYVGDTTYPPFWWGEIAVGLILLATAAWWRLDRRRDIALASAVTAVTAAAFVALYSQDLIALL